MYHRHDPPFVENFLAISKNNEKALSRVENFNFKLIKEILNVQHRFAAYHLWTINPSIGVGFSKAKPVLFSTYHKNLFTFFSAFDLTKRGFYGPARTLMRHTFESLIIAKFCAISKDNTLLQKWLSGEPIYFANGILKKIIVPNGVDAFSEFWELMCGYSHSTIYAQQISPEWKDNKKDIRYNFIFLRMLLECNYHLLNVHLITSSVRYYAESYTDKDEIKKLKSSMRELFRTSKMEMLPTPKTLIANYKRKWVLK
jgi:hypothetical protein